MNLKGFKFDHTNKSIECYTDSDCAGVWKMDFELRYE